MQPSKFWIELLHCVLSLAAQCIVIGPVCGFVCVCVCVCVWVCYHNNSKLQASIFIHQTGSVGEGSDHLQLIKFWPSCAPRKGSAEGREILAPPYYSQRAVFASLWALFFINSSYHSHYSQKLAKVNLIEANENFIFKKLNVSERFQSLR